MAYWSLRFRLVVATLLSLAAVSSTSGCTSSTTSSTTSPSTSRCDVTVRNSLETAPPSGGSGSLEVTTTRDCTWAASSAANWITIVSGSNGQGDGTAAYRVAANTEASARRTTLSVNDRSVTVAQEAACRYVVSPTSVSAGTGGVTATVRVDAGPSCEWTASSPADWIQATGAGPGPGSVAVVVAHNPGGPRTAAVVVAGQSVAVNQSGAAVTPCTYVIDPVGQTVAQAGSRFDVAVTTTGATCAWTATSNVPWITIASGGSATGAAAVTLVVAANSSDPRSGTVTIAGNAFTVNQSGAAVTPCTYAIDPAGQTVPPAGGSLDVAVTTGATCAWTATSNAPWITVASGGSAMGPAAVTLVVSSNSAAARSGTVTIAGNTFTVTQSPVPCNFQLSATSTSVAPGGAAGTVGVTATAGCGWSASSSAAWLTISSGGSGSGNGTVAFAAAANPGAARSATLTIAGLTYTVSQAAAPPPPCVYTLSASGQTVATNGATGSFTVTAGSGCAWTATVAANAASWLTIQGTAGGTGNGTVTFKAERNRDANRSGIIQVANQVFTVTQPR